MFGDHSRYKEEELYFDIYESERPYRWITPIIYGLIIAYVVFLVIGIIFTPIENGRPVFSSSEDRIQRNYVRVVKVAIEELQDINRELYQIERVFRQYGAARASEVAARTDEQKNRLMRIRKALENIKVPRRFSGVSITNPEHVNPQAFHPQLVSLVDLQLEIASEMYAYFSDFESYHWSVIDYARSQFDNRARNTFALFNRLVTDYEEGR